MARPPIIISNGGLLEKLAKGKPEQEKLKKAILALDKSTARWIIRKDNKKPLILWHLAGEEDHLNMETLRDWVGGEFTLGDEVTLDQR